MPRASSRSTPRRDNPRKVGKRDAVVAVGVFVDERYEVTRQRSPQFDPVSACFSMLFSVPMGRSRFACGTVTRPAAWTGSLSWTWLPFWATSSQPSDFRASENVPAVHALIRYTLMRIVQDILRPEDAIKVGYAQFELGSFMVKEIGQRPLFLVPH